MLKVAVMSPTARWQVLEHVCCLTAEPRLGMLEDQGLRQYAVELVLGVVLQGICFDREASDGIGTEYTDETTNIVDSSKLSKDATA
jgi:hypothetical protein